METENPTETPTKGNAPATGPAVDLHAVAKELAANVCSDMQKMVQKEVKKEVAKKGAAAKKDKVATLSEDALERLHEVYEETGDEKLGRILDEVCSDPDCQDGDEDDED